jgi:hypothetical protein
MKKVHSNLPSDHVVNAALRSLPRRTPPASLSASLRVMASRERALRVNRRSFSTAFTAWRDRTRLFAHNLMRPLALPAAGGLLSAVTLFGLWLVPTYPLRGNNSFDVPTGLSTEPVLKGTTALGSTGEEVVVDVKVDGQGRMIDYVVVSGAGMLKEQRAAAESRNHTAVVHRVRPGHQLWPPHERQGAAGPAQQQRRRQRLGRSPSGPPPGAALPRTKIHSGSDRTDCVRRSRERRSGSDRHRDRTRQGALSPNRCSSAPSA